MTTTQKAQTLWTDDNGRVACPEHMGCSATFLLQQNPRLRVIENGYTTWERMTKAEVTDWMEYLAEHGHTVACETCRQAVTA